MTAGFVLGERRTDAAGGEPGIVDTGQDPVADPTSPGSGKPCPPETIAKAGEIGLPTDLRQVMRIETVGGTTVWICADGAGRLYYQGKTGGPRAPLEQGTNGLLLPRVVRVGDNHYEVLDPKGNRFVITERRFEIDKVQGADQADEVARFE